MGECPPGGCWVLLPARLGSSPQYPVSPAAQDSFPEELENTSTSQSQGKPCTGRASACLDLS